MAWRLIMRSKEYTLLEDASLNKIDDFKIEARRKIKFTSRKT